MENLSQCTSLRCCACTCIISGLIIQLTIPLVWITLGYPILYCLILAWSVWSATVLNGQYQGISSRTTLENYSFSISICYIVEITTPLVGLTLADSSLSWDGGITVDNIQYQGVGSCTAGKNLLYYDSIRYAIGVTTPLVSLTLADGHILNWHNGITVDNIQLQCMNSLTTLQCLLHYDSVRYAIGVTTPIVGLTLANCSILNWHSSCFALDDGQVQYLYAVTISIHIVEVNSLILRTDKLIKECVRNLTSISSLCYFTRITSNKSIAIL